MEIISRPLDQDYLLESALNAAYAQRKQLMKSRGVSTLPVLNLMLCGSDELKSSISDLILKQTEQISNPRSEFIMRNGVVSGYQVTLVETPTLSNTQLSEEEVRQETLQCVSVCNPGVHAFIIIIPVGPLKDEDKAEINIIQKIFSSRMNDHTLVLFINSFSDETAAMNFIKQSSETEELLRMCSGRYIMMQKTESERIKHVPGLLDRVKKMEATSKFYSLLMYFEAQRDEAKHELEKILAKVKERIKSPQKHLQKTLLEEVSTLPVLNLMLCGSDKLKSLISDLILKQPEQISDPRSEFVMRTGVVSGYRVTLVETPTLSNTQLSEEEVRREILQCVSVCNSGVHAFIIIIPVGPLKDEDKAEIKIIQKIFSSRMNDHTLVLFINSYSDETAAMNFIKQSSDTEELLRMCSGRYIMMQKTESERIKQVPALLDQIKKMEATNKFYSLLMYFEAQRDEAKQELEKKLAEKEKRIKELEKHQTCAASDSSDSGSLRIVLIGKTGNGKSASGNTILGRKCFQCNASMTSVTNICQKGFGEIEGKSVAVVDTPGLFDTTLSNEVVIEEIVKCISLSAPGPHAFIIVLTIGRITNEELETLSLIKKIFGFEAARYTIVLFTHGDNLEDQTFQEFIHKSAHRSMAKLISDCGGRVHVFNNREKKDRTQVYDLIKMIEEMIKFNRNNYFTNEMFEMAENSIQNKQQEILKKKEEQMQAEKEALKNKFEQELETVRKSMEKEKEKLEQERQEQENMFREKEEALRREFKKKEEEEKEKRRLEDQKRAEEEKRQNEENDRMLKEMRETMEKQDTKEVEGQMRAEGEKTEREHFACKLKEEIKKGIFRLPERNVKKKDEEEQKRRKEKNDKVKEHEGKKEQMKMPFERQREDETLTREHERKVLREREREKEYEKYKLKIKKEYEERERIRKEEWQRRTSKDTMRREEERHKIKRLKEEIEREIQNEKKRREKEDRDRREKEERELNEIKKNYENKELQIKSKYEEEARRQAELLSDVRAQLELIAELIAKHQKDSELLNELYCASEEEDAQFKQMNDHIELELIEEIDKLKKAKCTIL